MTTVAVIVNGDIEIAERICRLLNVDDLLAKSSLGTPEAVAARESVDDETALAILRRAKDLDWVGDE